MTHNIQAVAAAISAIAEQEMSAANISHNDPDAMGRLMSDVEEMVARQLARGGMALTEAREMASNASMQSGRSTPESVALAEDAFRNRHLDAPEDVPATMAAVPLGNAQGNDGTAELIDSGSALPAAPAAMRPMTRMAPRAPEISSIPYAVTMKKVHEVFRGIKAGTPGFDFDVPIVNWERAHPRMPEIDPHYSFDLMHLLTVLYAINQGVSLNIVGPHGAGKTQLILQVAARLNFPVTVLPMDGQLTRRELIGQEKLRATEYGNESYFAPGLLPVALSEPGFILFDEIDRGVSDLQYACHSVYLQEGLKVLEDGGRHIPFHKYNRVFATANTKGRGSLDGMYQPPEEMSEATRDRWSIWLEISYQEVDEDQQVILAKVPGIDAKHAEIIASVAADIRNAYLQNKISQTCSMRQQLEVARFACFLCQRETDDERRDKCLRMAFERVITGRASETDAGAINNLLELRIPQAFTGDPLY